MSTKAAKGTTYAKALDAARLRGEWDGNQASGTGKELPWSELVRKYMKHNPSEQVTPSVATIEQQLRSALQAFYRSQDHNDQSFLGDSAAFKGEGKTIFPPVLPLNDSGNGWSGEGVSSAIRQLDDLRSSARDPITKQSVAALQAYAMFVSGQDENAIELLHEQRFLEDVDRNALKSGSASSDYTLALIMMGFTVYGMANERLYEKLKDNGYIPFAFAGYASTIDLHEGFRGGKTAKALRGLPPDEIERWGEVALYRNALFSVRNSNTPAQGLNALRAYQANAGRWISSFRVPQRLVIFRTYLAVLNRAIKEDAYRPPPSGVQISSEDCRSVAYQSSVMALAASRVEVRDLEAERRSRLKQGSERAKTTASNDHPRTTSKRRPAPWRALPAPPTWWANEFLTAQSTAAECLERTSQFPRAGRINKAALDLADELFKGWRANGERGDQDADALVDILYTLTRFTFHSQRITRLLFHVLIATENFKEAQRALELYIQIVDKAREGDAADAAGLVEEAKRRESGKDGPTQVAGGEENEENGNADGEDGEEENKGETIATLSKEAKANAEEVHIDADSDSVYIETLLLGSHVLATYLDNAQEADRLARKAVELYEGPSSNLGQDNNLIGKMKRISGFARAALCRAENDAAHREQRQDEALSLFKQSLTYDDQNPETYFHLAQMQSERHDINAAIRSARRAVELEPAHADYWHLLALLVSSQKDYRGALRVVEEGLAEAEDDEEEGEGGQAANGLTNGHVSTASSATRRTVLLSIDFHPTPRERTASILRMMITHNALEEIVEGSQAAIEAQREIFEYFHNRYAVHVSPQRPIAPSMANGHAKNDVVEPQYSTKLHGPGQSHNRFHSLTGMGQSGSAHALFHDGRKQNSSAGGAVQASRGSTAPAIEKGIDEVNVAITKIEVRDQVHVAQETKLLCSLWLMAAATFRRHGNLSECRSAIQEAESVNPGSGDVWLQLALWFEQQSGIPGQLGSSSMRLAIQALYKAMACETEHVGAAVHLSRLFVTNPLNPHVQGAEDDQKLPSLKDVASPLPQTSENFHASPLAAELLGRTESRKISASANATDAKSIEEERQSTQAMRDERKRLATLSMAEGLLISLTQGVAWNVPEAWLYLSKVMHQTDRPQRQRECLEYALQLERSKPIRSLRVAL